MLVLFYVAIALFFILCLLLGFIILMQENKSIGLGASFGGDVGGSMFGTSTADVLKKVTAWLAIIFFSSCILLSFWADVMSNSYKQMPTIIEQEVNV